MFPDTCIIKPALTAHQTIKRELEKVLLTWAHVSVTFNAYPTQLCTDATIVQLTYQKFKWKYQNYFLLVHAEKGKGTLPSLLRFILTIIFIITELTVSEKGNCYIL